MSDSLPCRLAFEGNIEQLKQLVEEQPGRAVQLDEDGRSCLHWAITGKQRPIVEYLMGLQGEAKPRVNVADEGGWTPLHIAASSGLEDIVQLLVRRGADIDVCTETGQTPLHYAASKNHLGVARVLIESKIDLDAKDNIGETALHRAAARDNAQLVQLLIDAGADVAVTDRAGNTAMHCACSEDAATVAKALFERSPGLMKMGNKQGQTPIEVATDNVARLLFSLREKQDR